VRVLVDSHIYVWAILNDHRLTPRARTILRAGENELFFSLVSLWELSIKIRNGKLRTITSSIAYLHDSLAANSIAVLPIDYQDLLALEQMDIHHKDPFDRILIAQAIHHGLAILSSDSDLRRYPVKVLW